MYSYDLQFKEIPPSVYAGFYNETPFYIGLTTNDPNWKELSINLFSQNSNSSPYQQPQNKWSHLVPQWKFKNSTGKVIEFCKPFYDSSFSIQGEIEITNLIGTEDLQRFGRAIATNGEGNILAVGSHLQGSPPADAPTYHRGKVQVFQYDYDGGYWYQIGADLLGDSIGDFFGRSVELSDDGTILLVGADQAFTPNKSGYIHIYRYDGVNWVLEFSYYSPYLATFYGSGQPNSISLSKDGKTVVIGKTFSYGFIAPPNNNNILIFKYVAGVWFLQSSFDPFPGHTNNFLQFRFALNYDGTILFIGSPYEEVLGNSNAGAFKVYQFNGFSWTQKGQTVESLIPGGTFGYNCAISHLGDIVAVGGASNIGIKTYRYNDITLSWEQFGNTINNSSNVIDLDSLGNYLVFGVGTNFYKYKYENNQWSLKTTITNPQYILGVSVAIDSLGDKFYFGIFEYDDLPKTGVGAVYTASQGSQDLSVLLATAYYVDDLPSNVNLIASLETSGFTFDSDYSITELPGYSNSLIFDSVEYEILDSDLDHLKITQDGKNDIDKFKWTNTYIPFIVTFHPSSSLHTNIYGLTSFDPILFTIPKNPLCDLKLFVNTIAQSSISWNDSSSVYLSSLDEYGFPYGGFYKGFFKAVVSSIPASISCIYCDSFFGESNQFQIKEFKSPYEIRRFNESWDSGDVIHSYALAEHTYENPTFFDNFIEVSVGGLESYYQSLGRTVFERIANFVKNNNDIEVSNLNQFYSILDSLDIPYDDYKLGYPSEVRKIVDIFSINKKKLMGSTCKCNKNFLNESSECDFCGHFHGLNRGLIENTSNEFVVSAGIPFVVENIYTKNNNFKYDVVYPSSEDLFGNPTAIVSSLPSISWMTSSVYYKYSFYTYISSFCAVQQEGIINWGDTYTTLTTSISSLQQWYGKNGLVEEILNYELHRGIYNV